MPWGSACRREGWAAFVGRGVGEDAGEGGDVVAGVAVEGGVEEFIEHKTGGAAGPGIVAPGFDDEGEVGEEAGEAVGLEGEAHRIEEEVEGVSAFAADNEEGRVEEVDDAGEGEAEGVAGVVENRCGGLVA